MRAPVLSRPTERLAGLTADRSLPARVFDTYLRFFQQVISPVDGARSTMYPTGSAYARQAIKKHGALLGSLMTIDRLMHEGNEEQVSPRIKKYGLWRVYDPVEANDWWWYGPDWVYPSVTSPPQR
ncbi:MAG: membrane protein insertion efficiency factor YidD [Candidatus Tectimicrobiota bacterium]